VGPAQIIDANFDTFWATVYLLVVSAAILVCCLCIMAATVRLCFGMARDNRLPASRTLAKVHPTLRTPIGSCITIAVLAAIPLLKYAGAGIVAIAATALIYLSYFLGNLAILWRGRTGGPRLIHPFKLGKWGMLVNILASSTAGRCWLTSPGPVRSLIPSRLKTLGALSLGIHFLNNIPILYTVLGAILIVGVIYYFVSEVRKPLPVNPPAETGAFTIPPESLPYRDVEPG